jgi:hypothetical protein
MNRATLLDPRPTADWLDGVTPPAASVPRPFVTISRLAGAGGEAIGTALARHLSRDTELCGASGWQVHDGDVCAEIAADPALASRLEDLVREVYRPGLEEFLQHGQRPAGGQPIPLYRVFRTMRHLAVVGQGVLIGRAGVMLTRDLPAGVHIRLIAPREVRLERMRGRFGLTRDRALEALGEQDESRARLFLEYFQRQIDDPLLYDAVWNTARVTIDAVVEATVRLVRDRLFACRSAPAAAGAAEEAPP